MTVRTSLLVRSVDCAYFLAFLVRVVRRQMWRCYLLLSYGGKRSIDYPAQGNPYNIGSHSCRRAFPPYFPYLFRAIFEPSRLLLLFFFLKMWNMAFLFFFASEGFHTLWQNASIYILKRVSNYIQTWEILEKKLSDKNGNQEACESLVQPWMEGQYTKQGPQPRQRRPRKGLNTQRMAGTGVAVRGRNPHSTLRLAFIDCTTSVCHTPCYGRDIKFGITGDHS